MKKLFAIILLVLVAIACKPAVPTPNAQQAPPLSESEVAAVEKVDSPSQNLPPGTPQKEEEQQETTAGPTEPAASQIDPYTSLGCEQILSADQFSTACNQTVENLVVTYKVGTKNCFVNIKDRNEERLTAGVTLTGFASPDVAAKEFQRRLQVLKVGADKSVGERAYTFPKIERETVNFIRRQFIMEVGADTRLCSKEGLLAVAQVVDKHLP